MVRLRGRDLYQLNNFARLKTISKKKKKTTVQKKWLLTVISLLGKDRQEGQEIKVILYYRAAYANISNKMEQLFSTK